VRIEVELWQLITLAVTLGAAICGAFWGMARMMMAQAKGQIDGQFGQIAAQFNKVSEHLTKQDDTTRRLERELLELRAELPRDYVRREDYVQAIAIITTKIDGVMLRMENMFHELAVRGRGIE
jgi:hypothetical protein